MRFGHFYMLEIYYSNIIARQLYAQKCLKYRKSQHWPPENPLSGLYFNRFNHNFLTVCYRLSICLLCFIGLLHRSASIYGIVSDFIHFSHKYCLINEVQFIRSQECSVWKAGTILIDRRCKQLSDLHPLSNVHKSTPSPSGHTGKLPPLFPKLHHIVNIEFTPPPCRPPEYVHIIMWQFVNERKLSSNAFTFQINIIIRLRLFTLRYSYYMHGLVYIGYSPSGYSG